MSAAAQQEDIGYQHWWEIARGVRHLADKLNLIEKSIAAKQSVRTTARNRADAEHVLAVHVPALHQEAKRLAKAAERLVHAALVAEVLERNAQAANE